MFSRRSSRDQTANALAELLALHGKPRFDLTGTNPTTAGITYPEELLPTLMRAQAESVVYHPQEFGLLSARHALSRLTGADPADILLTASSSEAYGFLFKLLCDPGDCVLIPAPSYPLFEHLAELEGVQAVPYRLAYDGAWHVDLDSVRRVLTKRTRAIVVVSPNNPTGQYLAASERMALEACGVPIISDEVFAPFGLERSPSAVSLPDGACLTFTLDGLSKRAGLPQLKLSWTTLSGPLEARRAARARLELIADTFLSVATPVQAALPEILELSPAITTSIARRCQANLALLRKAVHDSPLTLLRAEAGWSAVLRLPRVRSEEELLLSLLVEQGVLAQPGWFYDFESEAYAIVSLLGDPALFAEGSARLVEHVTRVSA